MPSGITGLYVKRPLSTFQPGMPVEQDFAGKQKADVEQFSGVHYLRAHIELMLFLKHRRGILNHLFRCFNPPVLPQSLLMGYRLAMLNCLY